MKLGTLLPLLLCLPLAACGDKSSTGLTTPEPVSDSADNGSSEASESGDAPPVARPTSWEMKNGHELIIPAITFESGTAQLTSASEAGLVSIQAYLEAKSAITLLRIEGHVAGDSGDGQALSEQRALAVTAWLVGHGIDCARLIPVGLGANKPAYGDERDTRIEAVNAAMRGRAIGGMPVEGQGQVAGDPCR